MNKLLMCIIMLLLSLNLVSCKSKNRTVAFLKAAEYGDFIEIQESLNWGMDVNAVTEKYHEALTIYPPSAEHDNEINSWDPTALILAAYNSRYEAVRVLLENGADINATCDGGRTALVYAAIHNDIDIARLLVEHKADLDVIDNEEATALVYAILEENFEMARFLLDAGANPDYGRYVIYKNHDIYWPLKIALDKEYDDIIKELLLHGADVNKTDTAARTVFMRYSYCYSEKILPLFLKAKPDFSITDDDDNSVLYYLTNSEYRPSKTFVQKYIQRNHRNIEGYTPFLKLVKSWFECDEEGDYCYNLLTEIDWLLDLGCNVNTIADDGKSALSIALKDKDFTFLAKLNEYGLKLNSRILKRFSENEIAAAACATGDLELLQSMVDSSVSPFFETKRADSTGEQSLVSLAAEYGHLALVEYLVSKGAGIKKDENNGNDAAMKAAYNGHFEVVKFLVEQGIDVNCTTVGPDGKEGPSDLFFFAVVGKNHELINYLMQKGADFDKTNEYGQRLLWRAVSMEDFETVKLLVEGGTSVTIVKLLKGGADVNYVNEKYRQSALTEAVKHNNLEIFNYLLDHGAKIGALERIDNDGLLEYALKYCDPDISYQILQYYKDKLRAVKRGSLAAQAAEHGDGRIFKLLGEMGEAYSGDDGLIILSKVCSKNNMKAAKYLLDNHIDLKIHNGERIAQEAADNALETKNSALFKLLLDDGLDINEPVTQSETPLIKAVRMGDGSLVTFLLDSGAAPNMKGPEGTSPLEESLKHDNLSITELLLKRGADVNETDGFGQTLLFQSIYDGKTEQQKMLITYGSDINLKDEQGITPLMYAADHGEFDSVRLLIASGAKVNEVDLNGRTALLHAAGFGYRVRIVKYLLDNGADIKAKDSEGRNALSIAKDGYKSESSYGSSGKWEKKATYNYLKSL